MADVLVVDDDPDVRAMVRTLVARMGHEVRAVATAEEALLRSAERRADLLLLDLSLPGLDGDEFLVWLDRGLGRPATLCIVSARPEDQLRGLAARYGATYLHKPFLPHELARAVDLALGGGQGGPEAVESPGSRTTSPGKRTSGSPERRR